MGIGMGWWSRALTRIATSSPLHELGGGTAAECAKRGPAAAENAGSRLTTLASPFGQRQPAAPTRFLAAGAEGFAMAAYGDPKQADGRAYRGMRVGGVHRWTYPDGKWTEQKVAPDRWRVTYTSLKRRRARAPAGSGAEVGSGYHWFLVAHQWADKLDANTYATHLEGAKYLVSFRKPGWKGWSTEMRGHKGARQRTIAILEDALARLKAGEEAGDLERPFSAEAMMELAKVFQAEVVRPLQPEPTGQAGKQAEA